MKSVKTEFHFGIMFVNDSEEAAELANAVMFAVKREAERVIDTGAYRHTHDKDDLAMRLKVTVELAGAE